MKILSQAHRRFEAPTRDAVSFEKVASVASREGCAPGRNYVSVSDRADRAGEIGLRPDYLTGTSELPSDHLDRQARDDCGAHGDGEVNESDREKQYPIPLPPSSEQQRIVARSMNSWRCAIDWRRRRSEREAARGGS